MKSSILLVHNLGVSLHKIVGTPYVYFPYDILYNAYIDSRILQ
jgi:hypothetical protein